MCNEEEKKEKDDNYLTFKTEDEFKEYLTNTSYDFIKDKFIRDLQTYINTIMDDDSVNDIYKESLNYYLNLLGSISMGIDPKSLINISEIVSKHIKDNSDGFYLN
jgi:hypothetical protein